MNEEIITFRLNEDLWLRIKEIKANDQRKLKKGFKKWRNYIFSIKHDQKR